MAAGERSGVQSYFVVIELPNILPEISHEFDVLMRKCPVNIGMDKFIAVTLPKKSSLSGLERESWRVNMWLIDLFACKKVAGKLGSVGERNGVPHITSTVPPEDGAGAIGME